MYTKVSEESAVSIITYLLTYLMEQSPFWEGNRFAAFYGTRKFITAFTSVRHLSLSWARSIQSIPPNPTFWRSMLILSSHLYLGLPRPLSSLLMNNNQDNLHIPIRQHGVIWQKTYIWSQYDLFSTPNQMEQEMLEDPNWDGRMVLFKIWEY
jgi:hypothetical protein